MQWQCGLVFCAVLESVVCNDRTYRIIRIGLCLSFAKPNLIVNTDLLIILGNYFSLIHKAEIPFQPQLYLKRFILYVRSLDVVDSLCLYYSQVSRL